MYEVVFIKSKQPANIIGIFATSRLATFSQLTNKGLLLLKRVMQPHPHEVSTKFSKHFIFK